MARTMRWICCTRLRPMGKISGCRSRRPKLISWNSPGHKRVGRESHGSSQMSPMLGSKASRDQPLQSPIRSNNQSFQQNRMQPREIPRDTAIDPTLSDGMDKPDRMQEQGYKEAVKAWSRFRFVRAGWFTPQEAIDYIE